MSSLPLRSYRYIQVLTSALSVDLLNDFETNFDKALLSVGTGQAGGQDTAAPQPTALDAGTDSQSAVDAMLLQELEESRQRLAKLESLNSALVKRSSQMEAESKEKKHELNQAVMKLSHIELELKMAKMEAAHAQVCTYVSLVLQNGLRVNNGLVCYQ